MKKIIFIVALTIILALAILFFPRKIQHGVFLESLGKHSVIMVDGKIKKFKTSDMHFEKFSVINFKYNAFFSYDFNQIEPIEDRIMIKRNNSYDLESMGFIQKANKCQYYEIDNNNKISKVSSRKLIVGKTNALSFLDNNKKLKTFIIFPADYKDMRIGISTTNFSSINHKFIELMCKNELTLYIKKENISKTISPNTKITIAHTGKNLIISFNDTKIISDNRVYLKGSNIKFLNLERGLSKFTPTYDGVLEFTTEDDGILVINELSLEQYLTKVVPSEMPVWGGLEALKCQAIAARTYALSDMLSSRYANKGFYVDDSTKSQVYNNILPEALSTQAVNETKGIVMTYNNYPIDAKYYSTSSGAGVSYKDIWFRADGSSDNKPYLDYNNYTLDWAKLPSSEDGWLQFYKKHGIRSYDSDSPYFRWKIDFNSSALEKCLNNTLKSLYDKKPDFITLNYSGKTKGFNEFKHIKDIRILKRSLGGNVISIEFIFDNGSAVVNADYNIRNAIKCRDELTQDSIVIERHDGSILKNYNSLPSSFFSVEKVNNNFIIYGGGYGHGVGMSQYGAMNMAKKGIKHREILNKYYKGIHFSQIY